jgi:GSH-dependent disulfide-bond oxidoreductase
MKSVDDLLAAYPEINRLFASIDARPAGAHAKAVEKDHAFKSTSDEEMKRALFHSNYPPAA